MLFCNVQQNSKAKQMTSFKLVMAFVVLIAINNWPLLNNIFSIFNGGASNLLSFEKFVSDILHICKIISASSSISIGLVAIFIKLAFILFVAFLLYVSFKHVLRQGSSEKNTNCYTGITVASFVTKDVYLQNKKLIC